MWLDKEQAGIEQEGQAHHPSKPTLATLTPCSSSNSMTLMLSKSMKSEADWRRPNSNEIVYQTLESTSCVILLVLLHLGQTLPFLLCERV